MQSPRESASFQPACRGGLLPMIGKESAVTDLVHFSFQAELAIEAAHRMIDAYRAWQIRQNQKTADLFCNSFLMFGHEINTQCLTFDELMSSQLSSEDPLKREAIAGLISQFLKITATLCWQHTIGVEVPSVTYSGQLLASVEPEINLFESCLRLAEKSLAYVEVSLHSVQSAGIAAASEPSGAKRAENHEQIECPIHLQGVDRPPIIKGEEKTYCLTRQQYRVIDILRGAYPENVVLPVLLHKCKRPNGKLPAIKDPVKCLKTLAKSKKSDFGKILYFPKGNKDGYGFKS